MVSRDCKRKPTSCGHVGTKAEASDVDEEVIWAEVVQNVALDVSSAALEGERLAALTWVLSVKMR